MERVVVGDQTLVCARWGVGPAEIVLLHDGLGSVTQWREVPAAIHEATGRTVFAYDRAGHGGSLPVPTRAWPTRWLHDEAVVLGALLDRVAVERPLLVGHSDGGSIALLAGLDRDLRGVVTLAAHSYVEPVCVDRIRSMRLDVEHWVPKLARAHDEPAAVFEAWSGVWTSDAFQSWDIRPMLRRVRCPALVVQGLDDEYGTPAQAWRTAGAIGDNATCLLLPGTGHLLHHEVPARVVRLVAQLDRSLPG